MKVVLGSQAVDIPENVSVTLKGYLVIMKDPRGTSVTLIVRRQDLCMLTSPSTSLFRRMGFLLKSKISWVKSVGFR